MNAREFLGIQSTHNPHRWYMPIDQRLCALSGYLYGGAGLGSALVALEETCGRPTIWATAQYLSFVPPDAVMDLDVIVPVVGKSVTQARVVNHIGDREILTINAALGYRDNPEQGQWEVMPKVPRAEDCKTFRWAKDATGTIHERFDLRIASGYFGLKLDGTPSQDGRCALWGRIPEAPEISAATLAIIADWMPIGLAPALGQRTLGSSLDNTIRIFQLEPTEWILCDIRVHAIHHGFGHGLMHLWSESGALLATASQSVNLRHYEIP